MRGKAVRGQRRGRGGREGAVTSQLQRKRAAVWRPQFSYAARTTTLTPDVAPSSAGPTRHAPGVGPGRSVFQWLARGWSPRDGLCSVYALNETGWPFGHPVLVLAERRPYASKYKWNSCGCGRMRTGSTSFSYLEASQVSMTSGVNTPPCSRKSWSSSRA